MEGLTGLDQLLEFDELKMYFGEPYHVTDKITITQPTIGDIIEFGDIKLFSTLSTFCANPTSVRLQLWDMGVDWNEITEWELFQVLCKNFTPEDTKLLFGDLNFSWFELYHNSVKDCNELIYIPRNSNGAIIGDQNGNPIINEDSIVIDEFVYIKMITYLREMFNIHPKVEKAKGKTTKQFIIEEERMNLEYEKAKHKNDKFAKSTLLPLISSMINHPGFKYKLSELKEIGIVQFMDSVQRLQVYENTIALMHGVYGGMIDSSKMNLSKELNWCKDLHS